MAITQQLARLEQKALDLCASTAQALAGLISGDPKVVVENIDLDWAPNYLLDALSEVAQPAAAAAAELGLTGSAVVNLEHPAGPPDYLLYDELRYAPPQLVARIALDLSSVSPRQLKHATATLARLDSEGMAGSLSFLSTSFSDLQSFYARAAKHHHAVAMWWD